MQNNGDVFHSCRDSDVSAASTYVNKTLRGTDARAHRLILSIVSDLRRLLRTFLFVRQHSDVICRGDVSAFVAANDIMVAMYLTASTQRCKKQLVIRYAGMLDDVLRELATMGGDHDMAGDVLWKCYDAAEPAECVEHRCALCGIRMPSDAACVPVHLAMHFTDYSRSEVSSGNRVYCAACLRRRWDTKTVHWVSEEVLKLLGECCFWANKDHFDTCNKRRSIIARLSDNQCGMLRKIWMLMRGGGDNREQRQVS